MANPVFFIPEDQNFRISVNFSSDIKTFPIEMLSIATYDALIFRKKTLESKYRLLLYQVLNSRVR